MRFSALVLMLAALATACTDFDERYIVQDLRVLAIRALDSPEEQVSGVLLLDPNIDLETAGVEDIASIFTVTDTQVDFIIEPLVVDPENPDGPFRLRARACLFESEHYTCDDLSEGNPVISAVDGIEGRRSRELTFRFHAPPAFLNDALAADPLGGFGGLFILLDIEIESPAGRVRAAKILTVNPEGIAQLLGLNPERAFTPNNNPEVCGIALHDVHVAETKWSRDGLFTAVLLNEITRSPCGSSGMADDRLYPDRDPIVYAGSSIVVRPLGANDTAGEVRTQEQEYYVLTLPQAPGELPGYRKFIEQLQANVYVSAGHLNDDIGFTRTTFGVQVTPEFTWTVPDTPGIQTVWVVLRDNRGGVSWIERTIDVRRREDVPVCAECPNDPDYDWTTAESALRPPR